eukprot:1311926-Rhodomonas_salina.3
MAVPGNATVNVIEALSALADLYPPAIASLWVLSYAHRVVCAVRRRVRCVTKIAHSVLQIGCMFRTEIAHAEYRRSESWYVWYGA